MVRIPEPHKRSRAYEVGVKGWGESASTVYAQNAGKAKYDRLLSLRDAGWEISFAQLTCRSLGSRAIPPTPAELAQREADAFNSRHPVGTMLRYWSGLKVGEPTGVAAIRHHATVMCDHAVIWMQGVASCHSLTHVEAENVQNARA